MSDREAIVTDATNDDSDAASIDAATSKLLAKWSQTGQEEDHSHEDETDAEPADYAGDRADGDEDEDHDVEHDLEDGEDHHDPDADEDDDRIVKVKVDGSFKDFKLGDLKRLAGRETALQTKESAAAERLKLADEQYSKYETATKHQFERAQKNYNDNFGSIDWNTAPTVYGIDVYNALKAEAHAAWNNMKFYETELQQLHTERRETVMKHQEAIKQSTVATLRAQIPNISEVYPKLREFAISKGVPAVDFDSNISAGPILILHSAYLAEKRSKPMTKAVAKAPTKVLKPGRNVETVRKASNPKADAKALQKLKQTGSVNDATDLLLARFTQKK